MAILVPNLRYFYFFHKALKYEKFKDADFNMVIVFSSTSLNVSKIIGFAVPYLNLVLQEFFLFCKFQSAYIKHGNSFLQNPA